MKSVKNVKIYLPPSSNYLSILTLFRDIFNYNRHESTLFLGISELPNMEPFLREVFDDNKMKHFSLMATFVSKCFEVKHPVSRIELISSFLDSFYNQIEENKIECSLTVR